MYNLTGDLTSAFLYDHGTLTDLGVIPDGTISRGRAINNLSHVAGFGAIRADNELGFVRHAFFWNGKTMIDIGVLPGADDSFAWGINDDDQVRDWVAAHSLSDIAALSTADKLRAIWTLQGGWISGDDLAAMGKICSSVKTKGEADAIRAGVNVLIFTDLGQRTQMRVFLSKMPR